jgi:hypothetical protein
MRVWQGVATDSLKFHPGPLCPTLVRPAVARPQGGQPVAVYYPFGHPTPYADVDFPAQQQNWTRKDN